MGRMLAIFLVVSLVICSLHESECWRRRRKGFRLHKKNHISTGQDDVLMGKDTGMKMKMLEDQAEYYDYLDDEV
ncbi:hypothetical protein ABFA07_009627 [Porites harrisoni]